MFEPVYRYNPDSCSYERVRRSWKQRLRAGLTLVLIGMTAGLTGYSVFRVFFPGMEQISIRTENASLKKSWLQVDEALAQVRIKLERIEKEDDGHYRVLLDMEKLSPEIRTGGSGGHPDADAENMDRHESTRRTSRELSRLRNRLKMQSRSFQDVQSRIRRAESMMDSRPALQPLDNRHITRFHPRFGMRVHPIFSDWRFHHGLDLTANTGTPVYASGDGLVTHVKYSGGYGNVIFINHGFGFETRYAHLSRFKVSEGQKVKRGEVIGHVGNSGNSTGPHLHYEVLYEGKWVNPIHFLYRDLKQGQYNEIIRSARED